MPRRYRFIIAGAVTAVLVAIGGIAVAESGGQSAEHRKNPTTTTGEPAAPTTPTVTTEAPKIQGPEEGLEGEGSGDSNRLWALCHALHSGSPTGQAMKAEHGQAFQGLDCNNVQPVAGGDEEAEGQGGPPPWANAGGGGGGGQGGGQGQGGGGNPHAAGAPGRNK